MKKIPYIIMMVVLAASCRDQDDIYRDYRVPNGTSYPAKPVSLECRPGNGRAELLWLRGSDPFIAYARVYWNNYTDSVQIAVPEDVDTVRCMIHSLAEGDYSFNVRSFNQQGTASVVAEVMSKVYGDSYCAQLRNRTARSIIFTPETNILSIEWIGKVANEVECILEYIDIQDNPVRLNIPLDASSTVIDGFKRGLSVNSLFVPPLAIDTFRNVPSRPKITMPVWHHQVMSGINTTESITRTTLTNHGTYIELTATANFPYVMCLGLTEPLNLAVYAKVYFRIEYQANNAVTDARLYYAKPAAAAGVCSNNDLVLENTGLDPADETKWATFDFDCSSAIHTHGWGAVTHRFRYDYVSYIPGNLTLYIRKVWYDVYTFQEVDL